jgi:YVTN family beta-propeller protein
VTPISTRTNTAGQAIPVGAAVLAIAVTPDGQTAYAVNYLSGTVTPISTRTNTAGPAIQMGSYPQAIAITPGRRSCLPVPIAHAAAADHRDRPAQPHPHKPGDHRAQPAVSAMPLTSVIPQAIGGSFLLLHSG